jgi:LysR family transcriptional regulator, nitrogen assimilation regulatory protein
MEIRQLRYFVRIADLGSFSRAAQALHIAQPALSQQIAQLEAELGQPLLVRSPAGVRLTDQGTVFYRHAQQLLKQWSDVPAAVASASAAPTGTVRVGLPQSTAAHYAMPLLAEVAARYPGVAIEFFDELSGNLLRGLNSGRLDIAVVVSDDDAVLLDAQALMDEALFLVSRAGNAPPGETVPQELLAKLPLALPGAEHGVRALVEQAVHARGLRLARPAVVANSMSIMCEAIRAGLGHGVMPWAAMSAFVAAGEFTLQEFAPPLQRRVHVCTARDATLPLAGQVVRTCLVDVTRRQVERGAWRGATLLPNPA